MFEKQEAVPLTYEQLRALHAEYSQGRPLRFQTPAMPGGFSLLGGLSNFFEKIGVMEKTPDWAREACYELCVEHAGVSAILAGKKADDARIALLIKFRGEEPPIGWLVAAWNAKTMEPAPFPTV